MASPGKRPFLDGGLGESCHVGFPVHRRIHPEDEWAKNTPE
jgi:hypothetical protein